MTIGSVCTETTVVRPALDSPATQNKSTMPSEGPSIAAQTQRRIYVHPLLDSVKSINREKTIRNCPNINPHR